MRIYPPRAFLGLMVMSYLGKVFDRWSRASIAFIAWFDTGDSVS